MLTKGTGSLKGMPNGPFSVAIQQETIHALEQRSFPEKTRAEADDWRWVHCEVSSTKRSRRTTDIITPDLAGEAISLEVDKAGSYPIIKSIISQSSSLILLFDSQRARDNGRDEDLFGVKLMSYLANSLGGGKSSRWRKLRLPVAIVFTKADTCAEAAENPEAFGEATMPGLVSACRRHFARHAFFAAGVVGSFAMATDGYGRNSLMPLHIEPRGILEPLQFVME